MSLLYTKQVQEIKRNICEEKDIPYACERCGGTHEKLNQDLHLHHKDENIYNNKFSNFEILCVFCHLYEHGNLSEKLAKIHGIK